MLCAAALGLMSLVPVLSHADALSDIIQRKTLKVAVPGDYPPFGYTRPDGSLGGYDIEVAKLIAQKMGVKVELVPVPSASRIPFLTSGKVDLIINTLGATKERRKTLDFSHTYAPYVNGLYATKDAQLNTVEKLAGKTVGVARGTIEDIELTKMIETKNVKDVTIKRFEDNNTLISAYVSGQVSILGTGNAVAATISKQMPAKALVEQLKIRKSACKVGLNLNQPALLAKVNEILDGSFTDGSLAKISQQELKAPLPTQAELDEGVVEP